MSSSSPSSALSSASTSPSKAKLLIAASGTGGHLFPAIATAEQLPDLEIEWLGVPDRLEVEIVPNQYKLHTIAVTGFQTGLSLKTLVVAGQLLRSVGQVRSLLRQGRFQAVFTTGGYIAAPAILAARSLGLPVVLHESNALPGKVTRWLSRLCDQVAIGAAAAATYLPADKTVLVGTPVRTQFRQQVAEPLTDLPIPEGVPLIVVIGGSQGAVAVNRLVRQAALAWLEEGAWLVHLTGDNDPEVKTFSHPHYLALPFYHNMSGLLQRSTLAISRAGAGTLTELAITQTPAILIPYPFAAEDHQTVNAETFVAAGAAHVFQQKTLTSDSLQQSVLHLLRSPDRLQQMATAMGNLAIADSAEQLADVIRKLCVAKPPDGDRRL